MKLEFRLIFQQDETGRFVRVFVTMDELLKQPNSRILSAEKYNLVAVNPFINKLDHKQAKIFAGDVINVFDITNHEYHLSDMKGENFVIRWNIELCGYSLWHIRLRSWWQGINPFSYPQGYELGLHVIGNEIENPELLAKPSVLNPTVVSLNELQEIAAIRAKINSVPLDNIVWHLDGKPYTVPEDIIEELRFSGLANSNIVDFIELDNHISS